MKNITELGITREKRPVRVLQFGEGNFLRAFVDYMIDIANEKGAFNGSIAIAKPIPFGSTEQFKKQDNLYTVVLRGKENGETVEHSRIITSVDSVFDCLDDYDFFMGLSKEESLRFIVSNTTEAGIVLDVTDSFDGLPRTYPGKLTKWLYSRYTAFSGDSTKGVILLPVELIENNGGKLLECVTSLCDVWGLPEAFKSWVEESCVFCNTLVDRIVTGKGDAELGYGDALVDIAEPFGLWVIESKTDISDELPLDKAGLPVIFTDNLKPYRERKVRILNGAHTASVLAGYLYGLEIVRDCMRDEVMGRFIRRAVRKEIVPFVRLPYDEVTAFAESVFERFENPFIDHSLLSISLNSVSKWKTRVLPSFRDHCAERGELPTLLTFSMAALIAFYKFTDKANDDEYALGVLREKDVHGILSDVKLWGEDLTSFDDFEQKVSYWLELLEKDAKTAVKQVLEV